MSSAPVVSTSRRTYITPEQAREVRARAWRFVFDCWERKKAAGKDGGEGEAKHVKNEGGPGMT